LKNVIDDVPEEEETTITEEQQQQQQQPSLRRSKRQVSKKITKYKSATNFDSYIEEECEDGLEIRLIENKGRGIFAMKKFFRGDYIVEYAGDLISYQEAKHRETIYGRNHKNWLLYVLF